MKIGANQYKKIRSHHLRHIPYDKKKSTTGASKLMSFKNNTNSIQELDFDRSVFMAAIC